MGSAVAKYFGDLAQGVAGGWNRFWFTRRDPFSLSVLRFFTGLVALWLHATLTPDVVRYFAAGGWLPVDVVRRLAVGPLPWSYLDYISAPRDLMVVHMLGLVVLVLFTAGAFTRLTSIAALIVMLSDVNRAPMITTLVEPIVTLVMFYLCLGPSGAYWSLDRWRARRQARLPGSPSNEPRPSLAANIAVRLIQVHLALIYAMMGLSQLMGETWWNGTAVWWLAARGDVRWIDLTWLPLKAVNFVTHAIVLFELAFSLLVWHRLARPLLLAAAVAVWTLVGLLTGQVTFALMMLIANLAFVAPDTLRQSLPVFAQCRPPAD